MIYRATVKFRSIQRCFQSRSGTNSLSKPLSTHSLGSMGQIFERASSLEKGDLPAILEYCVDYGDDVLASAAIAYFNGALDIAERNRAHESLFLAALKAKRWEKAAYVLRRCPPASAIKLCRMYLEQSLHPELALAFANSVLAGSNLESEASSALFERYLLQIVVAGRTAKVETLLKLCPETLELSESQRASALKRYLESFVYLASNKVLSVSCNTLALNNSVRSSLFAYFGLSRDTSTLKRVVLKVLVQGGQFEAASSILDELRETYGSSTGTITFDILALEAATLFLRDSLDHFRFRLTSQRAKRIAVIKKASLLVSGVRESLLSSTELVGLNFPYDTQEVLTLFHRLEVCALLDQTATPNVDKTLRSLLRDFQAEGMLVTHEHFDFTLWARSIYPSRTAKEREERVSDVLALAKERKALFGLAPTANNYTSLLVACRPSENTDKNLALGSLQLDSRVWLFLNELKTCGLLSNQQCMKVVLQVLVMTHNFADVQMYLVWMVENRVERPISLFNAILERARVSVDSAKWAVSLVPEFIEEEQLLSLRREKGCTAPIRARPTGETFFYLLQCALKCKNKTAFCKFSHLAKVSKLRLGPRVVELIETVSGTQSPESWELGKQL